MNTEKKIKEIIDWFFNNKIECQYICEDCPELNLYKGDTFRVIGVNMFDELILDEVTFTLPLNEVKFK